MQISHLKHTYQCDIFIYFIFVSSECCFSVKEFMDFTSKILVERTSIAQRASVKEQGKCLQFSYKIKQNLPVSWSLIWILAIYLNTPDVLLVKSSYLDCNMLLCNFDITDFHNMQSLSFLSSKQCKMFFLFGYTRAPV